MNGAFFLSLLTLASIFGVATPKEKTFRSTSTEKMKSILEKTLFVISTQQNSFHLRRAEKLKESLRSQAKTLLPTAALIGSHDPKADGRTLMTVHFAHEIFPTSSARIVRPMLPEILANWGADKTWVFFCQENTLIDLRLLLAALIKADPLKSPFMGRPLVDRTSTIIHHYDFWEDSFLFTYPDFASGFFLSLPLIKTVVPRWDEEKEHLDFTIDPKYELAKFLWHDGKGVTLKEMPELCGGRNSSTWENHCATFYDASIPFCGETNVDDLVVGVKTFQGFHASRVPIVKKTWAPDARGRIFFFSDTTDEGIPTVASGVPNTEYGHCAKTMALIEHARQKMKPFKWVLVADDDTLISLPRLRKLLSCYDPLEDVALGESYGYGLSTDFGYDYITGGGGMVFSVALVEKLVQCRCRKIDTPDDMHIGMCLSSLEVPALHWPQFHQARPMDYSLGYLEEKEHISFHKFDQHDPVEIYKRYLYSFDKEKRDEL